MSTKKTAEPAATTLSFDRFWGWLQAHPNCVLRAGTPEAVLYDDEDLHWHFTAEGPDTLLVQLIRGKRLVGELLVLPAEIAYVQGEPAEGEDEYVFELVSESESDRVAAYHFVLSHGFDEDEPVRTGRAVH
jgi:hypothetical protein